MSQDFVRRLSNPLIPQGKRGLTYLVRLDLPLLFLLVAISAYGLTILYSAAEQQVEPIVSQGLKVLGGFVLMAVITQIPPTVFKRLAPWFFAAGILLLLLVHFYGVEVKGSRRWLRIPGLLSFQPSELMKLIVPMILAWYFHDRHLPPKTWHLFWSLVFIGLPVVLILRQPDLGTAMIIGVSGMLVLLFAGISWRIVFYTFGMTLLSLPVVWFFVLREYQRQRISTLLNSDEDPLGAGWSIIQSKTAIGSGGFSGKGLFSGTQSHLEFLPESQTDFIVAVLGEELGLLGVSVLLLLYILLICRGVFISIKAQDTFGRLVSGSITFTFFAYVFVNMGMVSGILPVVGLPLPLVSQGGTSVLTILAGFGILMSIHTHRSIIL